MRTTAAKPSAALVELRAIVKAAGWGGRVTVRHEGPLYEVRHGGSTLAMGMTEDRAIASARHAVASARTVTAKEAEEMDEADAFAKAEADIYFPEDSDDSDD